MKLLEKAYRISILGATALPLAFASCQKREAAEKPQAEQAPQADSLTRDDPQQSAPIPAPLFDIRGETRIGDVNGDGLSDTITAVHGNSVQAIRSIFSQVIPDSSLRESGDTNSNWGLTIRLGTTSTPKRSDSLYLPGISSVIYDQGGPDLVRMDTLAYFDLREAAAVKGQSALSLFTQSGNPAYLYYLKGKYRVYWPESDPE